MVEQASDAAGDAGDVRVRRMFGEYALCLGDEVVGLPCDDQAFLMPTKVEAEEAQEEARGGVAGAGSSGSGVWRTGTPRSSVAESVDLTANLAYAFPYVD